MVWRVSIVCSREQAEELARDHERLTIIDPSAVLSVHEHEAGSDEWLLDIFTAAEPDESLIDALEPVLSKEGVGIPRIAKLPAPAALDSEPPARRPRSVLGLFRGRAPA